MPCLPVCLRTILLFDAATCAVAQALFVALLAGAERAAMATRAGKAVAS